MVANKLQHQLQIIFGVLLFACTAFLIQWFSFETAYLYDDSVYQVCLEILRFQSGQDASTSLLPRPAPAFLGYISLIAVLDSVWKHSISLVDFMAWINVFSTSLGIGLCLPLFKKLGLEGNGLLFALVALLLSPFFGVIGSSPNASVFAFPATIGVFWAISSNKPLLGTILAALVSIMCPEGLLLGLSIFLWTHKLWILPLSIFPGLFVLWQSQWSSVFQIEQLHWSSDGILAFLVASNPLILLIASVSFKKLKKHPVFLSYCCGILFVSCFLPITEQQMMPCVVAVFFLFGASLEQVFLKRQRIVAAVTISMLLGFFILHYPDKILDASTSRATFKAAIQWVNKQPGSFSILGSKKDSIRYLTQKETVQYDLGQQPQDFESIAHLVKTQQLRYQLVSNYYPEDIPFLSLEGREPTKIKLKDGSWLYYKTMLINISGHFKAIPKALGLWFDKDIQVRSFTVFEIEWQPH